MAVDRGGLMLYVLAYSAPFGQLKFLSSTRSLSVYLYIYHMYISLACTYLNERPRDGWFVGTPVRAYVGLHWRAKSFQSKENRRSAALAICK